MHTKQKMLGFFTYFTRVIFIICVFSICFLILGDVQAGLLNGEPETVWGLLIAIIVVGPMAVAALVISKFLNETYKKIFKKPVHKLWTISFTISITITMFNLLIDNII